MTRLVSHSSQDIAFIEYYIHLNQYTRQQSEVSEYVNNSLSHSGKESRLLTLCRRQTHQIRCVWNRALRVKLVG